MVMANRIEPVGPMQAYRTYDISAPLATHYRKATCQEVDCPAYANGWDTRLDPNDSEQRKGLDYIRLHSGRHYIDMTKPADAVVTLRFPPGQQCFRPHRVPLEREAVYRVRGGDWRGSTGLIVAHKRPADWVEDFALHQQGIADRIERG